VVKTEEEGKPYLFRGLITWVLCQRGGASVVMSSIV